MADVLKHGFISPKLDGTDATQIQPSHWNAGHKFVGGVEGDVLYRTTADPTFGAFWDKPGRWKILTTSAVGTQHNFDPGIVGHTIIRCAPSTDLAITGLSPAIAPFDGQVIRIECYTGPPVSVILWNNNAGSTAGRRLFNVSQGGGSMCLCGNYSYAEYIYVTANQGWTMRAHAQGALRSVGYGGITTGANTGSWTIPPANWIYRYGQVGRLLTVHFEVTGSTLSTFGAVPWIGYPTGITAATASQGQLFRRSDAGAAPIYAPGQAIVNASTVEFRAALDGSGFTDTASGAGIAWIGTVETT